MPSVLVVLLLGCNGTIDVPTVDSNVAPSALIATPTDGSWSPIGEAISLTGRVVDADGLDDIVTVRWASDLDGILAEGPPTDDGFTSLLVELSPGLHELSLTAVDTAGLEGRDQVTLVLEPPDCSAWDDGQQVWDCDSGVDFCDTSPQNLAAREACCDCDPTLCDPPSDCPLPPTGFPGPVPTADCSAHPYQGAVYDCATDVDLCDTGPDNTTARLACCDCDPAYCVPPASCPPSPPPVVPQQSSCMTCHNGAMAGAAAYSGPGMENPHPFGSAARIPCEDCHGGDPTPGVTKAQAHVPDPPAFQSIATDPVAYFDYLTRTGIDAYPDWTVGPATFTGLDWLQFMNPGDTRVVAAGRGCGTGSCHADIAEWVARDPMATASGIFGKARFSTGARQDLGITEYGDTAADRAFRPVLDPDFVAHGGFDWSATGVGRVPELLEVPVESGLGQVGAGAIFNDTALTADSLIAQQHTGQLAGSAANQVIDGSRLDTLLTEAVSQACGDCHLGSAGANDRYADFRSSGCSTCHMPMAPDGQAGSLDPNISRLEPASPDQIMPPERPHVDAHRIRSIAKVLSSGTTVQGVSDMACAGCHQGTNQTVLQYWGIRTDDNRDVVTGQQYPANPATHTTALTDARLFPPNAGNTTFHGRTADQFLVEEDYDDDGRDDTPPDVHHEAGMGCIDCHGRFDLHGGEPGAPALGVKSHQDQTVGITCASCHGTIADADGTSGAPTTVACVDDLGQAAECAVDRFGNPLRNVTAVVQGNHTYFRLRSRVTGALHWVPLTEHLVDSLTDTPHPGGSNQNLYSPNASYAMGRISLVPGPAADGIGPRQTAPLAASVGFSHGDVLDCSACHATWTNSCIGCHLKLTYNAEPGAFFFSNITAERTVLAQTSTITYQSPVLSHLTVGADGRITQGAPNGKLFFQYEDYQDGLSPVFAFTDRAGFGNVQDAGGRNRYPALAHNRVAPHSTRGRATAAHEGVRSCQSCHLTAAALSGDYNADGVSNAQDYDAYVARYLDGNDFDGMNQPIDAEGGSATTLFEVLKDVIGRNTGNQLNHPIYVAMNAGLGTGLFLFDADGCPVNPLDTHTRAFCAGAPANGFAAAEVAYDLDRAVERSGAENVSTSRPAHTATVASSLRDGSLDPSKAGPLGASVLERLTHPTTGLVLDAWIGPEGTPEGDAGLYLVP
jgi:hypothetical protein